MLESVQTFSHEHNESQQYVLMESVCAKVFRFLLILSIVSPVAVVVAEVCLKCIMVLAEFTESRLSEIHHE